MAGTGSGSGSGSSKVQALAAQVDSSSSAEGNVAFSTGFEKFEASSEADDDDDERQALLPTRSVRGNNITFERFGKASHHQPVERYEGSHRYGLQFEWEPREERKLVRKVGLFSFERGL